MIFTKVFYILGFDLRPDREADEDHINLQGTVQKNRYQNQSLEFCMMNFIDTSKSTKLPTSQ